MQKVKIENLNEINIYIRTKFRKLGANIEDIIFCPHHWNDNCFCRKPKTGMFYMAQKNFNIDLTNSIFIGDQITDKMSAYKADIPYYNLNKRMSLNKLLKKIFS